MKKILLYIIAPLILFIFHNCKKLSAGEYLFIRTDTESIRGSSLEDITASPTPSTVIVSTKAVSTSTNLSLTYSGSKTIEFDQLIWIKKGNKVTATSSYTRDSEYHESYTYSGEIGKNNTITGTYSSSKFNLHYYSYNHSGYTYPEYTNSKGTFTLSK